MKNFILIVFMALGLLVSGAQPSGALDQYYALSSQNLVKYIQDQPGKRAVFFYTSWCPHCQKAMPGIIEIAKKRKSAIVAVSLDKDPNRLIAFLKKFPSVPFHVISVKSDDKLRKDLAKIGIRLGRGIPYTAMLDETGKVVKQGNFYVQDIAKFVLE